MQDYRPSLRLEVRQPPEQRQVPSGIFPAAERQSTDGSGKSSSHDRTAPAKLRRSFLGAKASTDSKDHTYRHAPANQVTDKLGKTCLGGVQHRIGRNGTKKKQVTSSGDPHTKK